MEKKTSYSTKFIEIAFTKTQIKKFYRDRYNVKFIKNEVIAINQFRYQSYKEGWVIDDGFPIFLNQQNFMKYFNNTYLKFNPQLKFVKETSTMAIQQAVREITRSFEDFFKGKKGYPRFKKKRDIYELGVCYTNTSRKKYGWCCKGKKLKIPTLGDNKQLKNT